MSLVFRLNEYPINAESFGFETRNLFWFKDYILSSHATASGCRDLALTALPFGSGHVLSLPLAGPLGSTEQSLPKFRQPGRDQQMLGPTMRCAHAGASCQCEDASDEHDAVPIVPLLVCKRDAAPVERGPRRRSGSAGERQDGPHPFGHQSIIDLMLNSLT